MLGFISLVIFILILLASLRGWIPQDLLALQSVLVLTTLALLGVAVLFQQSFHPAQVLAAMTLHPITATIAGFLLAGAVEAAGGFSAAARILSKLGKGVLGLSGVVVVLVNVPNIFAMPCGRVWAAALIPVALAYAAEIARIRNDLSLVAVVVFGLIINAAASCGPSPLGGIGMMGEGMARLPLYVFSNPQQIAIMMMTLFGMAAMAWLMRRYPVKINASVLHRQDNFSQQQRLVGYFALFSYVIGLTVIFIVQPPVPIQTLLIGMTILVMIVGKVSLKELFRGVILHPVTAMVAGFMVAGALLVTGGFDAMTQALTWLAIHTPLGFTGVGVMLIYVPTIFPMPCGRVLAASLLPGVIMFAEVVGQETRCPQCLPAMLIAFVLSAAASCGPSPLGGIGGIGEGNLGLPHGISAMPMQFGIILGVPIAALIVTYMGLSVEFLRINETVLSLFLGAVSGMATNTLLGYPFYQPGGIMGGSFVGGLLMVM
ncbi:MAG: hypothetical protein WCO26_03755 [Deltaproteobacteria bacterium]